MSDFALPPIKSSSRLEDMICDLFNTMENTSSYKRNIDYQIYGRNGQKQKGIDIVSQESNTVIQCKVRNNIQEDFKTRQQLIKNIDSDLIKMRQLPFTIRRIIFVSTFRDDSVIQEYIKEIRDKNILPYTIYYWGWDSITKYLEDYDNILKKYFRTFFRERKLVVSSPDGSLGSDLGKNNYINYLIKKYGDWKQIHLDRTGEKFNWGRFKKSIKTKYKIQSIKDLPLTRFDTLQVELQNKIDGTVFGRIRKKRGIKNYSTFEEFLKNNII